MKLYNIKQIQNYLATCDSLGDVSYFLTEERIDEADRFIEGLTEPTDDDLEEVIETNETEEE